MSATTPARAASSSGRQQPFLRPVPRRRSEVLVLKPADTIWLVALAFLSCGLVLLAALIRPADAAEPIPYLPHPLWLPLGGASLATASVGAYLAGLRLKDRSVAIIAGLMVSASLALAAGAAQMPLTLLAAALAVFSLFSYAMGATIAALVLAGVAGFAQADMIAVGLALAGVSLLQRRRHAWMGALLFFLLAAGALGLWIFAGRHENAAWLADRAGTGAAPIPAVLVGAAVAPFAWFLFPYLADWSQRMERAKWWPSAAVSALYLAVSIARHPGGGLGELLPLLPIVYLMAAAGISRLLPAFAGEFARPASRYAAAIAAVGALLAARGVLEWQALSPHGLAAFLATW